jgi:hypothetical protein
VVPISRRCLLCRNRNGLWAPTTTHPPDVVDCTRSEETHIRLVMMKCVVVGGREDRVVRT